MGLTEQYKEAPVTCAAEGCANVFVVRRVRRDGRAAFCSSACRLRQWRRGGDSLVQKKVAAAVAAKFVGNGKAAAKPGKAAAVWSDEQRAELRRMIKRDSRPAVERRRQREHEAVVERQLQRDGVAERAPTAPNNLRRRETLTVRAGPSDRQGVWFPRPSEEEQARRRRQSLRDMARAGVLARGKVARPEGKDGGKLQKIGARGASVSDLKMAGKGEDRAVLPEWWYCRGCVSDDKEDAYRYVCVWNSDGVCSSCGKRPPVDYVPPVKMSMAVAIDALPQLWCGRLVCPCCADYSGQVAHPNPPVIYSPASSADELPTLSCSCRPCSWQRYIFDDFPELLKCGAVALSADRDALYVCLSETLTKEAAAGDVVGGFAEMEGCDIPAPALKRGRRSGQVRKLRL